MDTHMHTRTSTLTQTHTDTTVQTHENVQLKLLHDEIFLRYVLPLSRRRKAPFSIPLALPVIIQIL